MFGFGGGNDHNDDDPLNALMRVFANELQAPLMMARNGLPDGATRFGSYTTSSGGFSPAVDIKDSGDSYHLEADLPGVKQEDINLTVHDSQLCLSASRKLENSDFYRRERRQGSFERCWTFPSRILEDTVKANLRDGVLKVDLQKGQATHKTITID